MLREVIICLGLAVVASAMPSPYFAYPYGYPGGYPGGYHAPGYYGYPYYHPGYYYGYPYNQPYGGYPLSKLVYHGTFKGSCEVSKDGLYYVDEKHFAFCSHGQKTVQPCAEGSANPPLDHFEDGGYYGFYEFCSINLVANGYLGAHPAPKPGYHDNVAYKVEETSYHEKDAGYHGDGYEKAPKPAPAYTEEVHSAPPAEGYGYKKEKVFEYTNKNAGKKYV